MKSVLENLPNHIKVEVTKSDLLEFANTLLEQKSSAKEQSKSENDIVTKEWVMQITGLSSSSVYRKTSNNEIPFYKVGKTLLFKKSEIIQWIEEGKQKTTKEIDVLAKEHLYNHKKRNRR